MKALILAGGLGTRMRPLTYSTPKCLLPINNRTILEYQLDLLRSFDEVVLATNYLEDNIKEYLKNNNINNVTINNEAEPLGTAGAILNARDLLGSSFVVLNGDIITNCDIEIILDSGPNTILVQKVDDVSRYGSVTLGEDGTAHGFNEKQDNHAPGWINAGVYYLDTRMFGLIQEGEPASIERDVFPVLAGEGALKAVKNTGFWYDVGTKEDFINANLSLSGSDRVIGRNCEVHDSEIVRSVVMDGCTIRNSFISDCIIGPNNNICDLTVENAIIP